MSADLPALGDDDADWATNPPSACGSAAPELTIGQGEKGEAKDTAGHTATAVRHLIIDPVMTVTPGRTALGKGNGG